MKQFNMDHDFFMLTGWMSKRGLAIPHPRNLPPTGVIIDNAACGFIIKCDNGTGILDFVISNPDVPPVERGHAVEEVIDVLIETAKRMGLHSLYCNTEIESVYKMTLRHGFEPIGNFKALMRGL